ncbi:MAG: DUF1298 domain-containing protein [Actinobacteria bacterium]|nr:DUF1298 domain-containing protein [Actinomycetota bacterium]
MPDRPYLSQNDTIMWMVEADPLLRSTIMGIIVLAGAPEWDRLEARVERVTHQVAALRERVAPVPLHPTTLQWIRDPDFDLGYHLRHIRLPEGSDQQDVLDWARTQAMGGFDSARPLWEFTLIEGLVDGRAAFVMKAHHVVTDGIGAVQLAAHLFDFEPDPAGGEAPEHVPTYRTTSLTQLREVVAHDVAGALDFTRHQVASVVPTLLHVVREPQDAVNEVVETAKSVARVLWPATNPKSHVMVGRMLSSNFRALEVPMTELRDAAKKGGGRLNDAFLAGITAGLHRYHAHHGHEITELRVAMPISQRGEHDPAGGNHVSVTRFVLPVGAPDAAHRISAMHEVVDAVRHERALHHTEAIAGFLNLMPRGVIGAMLKGVDFLASNVPGVPIPMWLEGQAVERFFPFGPTAGSALNITLMSYNGMCCMGVNSDSAAVPDPDVLLDCLRAGFAEVCAVAA